MREILTNLGIILDDTFKKKNAAEELGFEYVRLFVGTGPKHVPPYESVFRDEREIGEKKYERLMWGPSAVAVKDFYAKLGFEPEDEFKDMPDHLGVELGFMEQLCIEEGQSYETKKPEKAEFVRNKQLQFLEEHLLRWIDDFAKEVKEFTKMEFYSSVASVTAEFIKSEKEYLSESAGENTKSK